MLIFGTGGHALEILDELENVSVNFETINMFNDLDQELNLFKGISVLKSSEEVMSIYGSTFDFIIAIGNPFIRSNKFEWLTSFGGISQSIISASAKIGKHHVSLGAGLNIMSGVNVSSDVQIGKGSLINRNANIHHHVIIGEFCEIAPSAIILGNVEIGNQTFIGSGAIILPGIKIGNKCIIGAGSIVTKDLQDGSKVKGNPAR